MPAYEVMGLNDKAVVWAVTGRDRHNEPTRGVPCTVSLNFSGTRRTQRMPDNTVVSLEGSAIVDRSFNLNDLLWLGTSLEYTPEKVTADNPVMYVVAYTEDPDLKGRTVLRTITLARYGGTLPPRG